MTKIVVGERYCWGPFYHSQEFSINGICESIDEQKNKAVLVTNYKEVWEVPFHLLHEYDRKKELLKKDKKRRK